MRAVITSLVVIILMGLVGISIIDAQQSPKPYEPSEVQSLRLQVAQKDAQLAFNNLQQAQAEYQKAFTALNKLADQTKKDNKWPDDVHFDFSTLTFTAAPAKPAPAPEPAKKPAEPVKK